MEQEQQTVGSFHQGSATPPQKRPLLLALHGIPGIELYDDRSDTINNSSTREADSISNAPAVGTEPVPPTLHTCPICNRSYRRASKLGRHMSLRHSQQDDDGSTMRYFDSSLHLSSLEDPHDSGRDLAYSTNYDLVPHFSGNHISSLLNISETTLGDDGMTLSAELEACRPSGSQRSTPPEYPSEISTAVDGIGVECHSGAQRIGDEPPHVSPSDPPVVETAGDHEPQIPAISLTTMGDETRGAGDQSNHARVSRRTSLGSIFRRLWRFGQLWRPTAPNGSRATATATGPTTLRAGVKDTSISVMDIPVFRPSDTVLDRSPEDGALVLSDPNGSAPPNPTESTVQQCNLGVLESSDPPHSPSRLAIPLFNPDDEGTGGKVGGLNGNQVNRVYHSPLQSRGLARVLSNAIPPEIPIGFRLHSRALALLALPSNVLAPVHYAEPPDLSNDPESPFSELPLISVLSSLRPRIVDAFSSGTTKYEHIVISETCMPPIHQGDIVNILAEANSTSNLTNDRGRLHASVRSRVVSLFRSLSICQFYQHDKDEGRLYILTLSPNEFLVATTVAIRTILDSGSGATRADSHRGTEKLNKIVVLWTRRHDVNNSSVVLHSHFPDLNNRPNTARLKPIVEGPNAPYPSCSMMINANRGAWDLSSGAAHYLNSPPWQRQSTLPRELRRVLPTGLKGPCVVRLVVKCNQLATIVPLLSSTSFPIHSCRRKLRVGRLLGLICPYAFSWDPRGPDPVFPFSYESGSSQTPGNTYPRLEDGSNIWSGQGPGPVIDPLLSRELESWGLSGRLGDLVPPPSGSLLGAPYGTLGGSFTQSRHSAPDPPVPLQQGALRELLSKVFSAGLALGLSLGSTHTTFQEPSFNGFKSQQSNPPGGAQEQNISTFQHSTFDMPLDLPFGEATRPSALPLGGFGTPARETFGLSGVELSVDMPDQPIADLSSIVNTRDLADDATLEAWLQQPALAFDADSIIDPHLVTPLITDGLSFDAGICLGTEAGLTMSSLDSMVLPRPTQSTMPPDTGPESRPPGSQLDQAGGGGLHSCPRCGKSFRRPYLLDDHMSAHNNEKPYGCTFEGCGERYGSYSNAMRHLRKAHPDAAHLPPPSRKRARVETPRQTPEAGPSNHDTFRGNPHSSPAFISYTPRATRHKKRRHN